MSEISQREAMRLKKRVAELEDAFEKQRSKWSAEYVGGVHLGYLTRERDCLSGRIEGARLLKHAVVVIEESNGRLSFYALPQVTP